MKAIDILRANDINMQLTLEGVLIKLDKTEHLIDYDKLSETEAILMRFLFASPRPHVIPGQETNLIFDHLEKQAEEALKKVKKEEKKEPIVYDGTEKEIKELNKKAQEVRNAREARPFNADIDDPSTPTTVTPESKL